MDSREEIVNLVGKFYNSRKAIEVAKILDRTNHQDDIQDYIVNKARVDVLTVSEHSKVQTERIVAFMVNHPHNGVIKYFLKHRKFKPFGLTSSVQIAYLCVDEWKDIRNDVLEILEIARDTSVEIRKEILTNAGYKNFTPMFFIEYLLNTRLGVSLFNSRSKYYNGKKIKNVDVYDSAALRK